MGRQPWTSRLTVEECPVKWPIAVHRGRLIPGFVGVLSWKDDGDGAFDGSLKIEIGTDGRSIISPPQFLSLGDTFCYGDGQTIPLSTTHPHFGGERVWFLCDCGRRSANLYLPGGQTIFRCRLCCDLTYQSAQEHNTQAEKDRGLVEELRRLLADTNRGRGKVER